MEFHVIDFVQHILNIVLLFLILRAFIYKPVSEFMDKRRAKYQAEQDALASEAERMETLRVEYETSLGDAKASAKAIADKKLADANRQVGEILQKAKGQAEQVILEARERANEERTEILEDLRHETVNLAVDLASQLLAREVTEADNEQLIDHFFEQVGPGGKQVQSNG